MWSANKTNSLNFFKNKEELEYDEQLCTPLEPKRISSDPARNFTRVQTEEKAQGHKKILERRINLINSSQEALQIDNTAEADAADIVVPKKESRKLDNVMEGNLISNINHHEVYTKMWLPEGRAKALLYICHGFAEHSNRYDREALAFNRKGVLVFSNDHQGHGLSGGDERGDITDYEIYISDAIKHIEIVATLYSDMPLFIWGHGMGGCIALTLARYHKEYFTGMLLTAPLVIPDPLANTPLKQMLAKNISKINPKFDIGRYDPYTLFISPEKAKEWSEDPLVYHGAMRIRWANIMTKAAQENYEMLYQISLPYIVLQGDYDEVVVPEGINELRMRTSSIDKTFNTYQNCAHYITAENDNIVREMVAWLVDHIQSKRDRQNVNIKEIYVRNSACADAERNLPTSV